MNAALPAQVFLYLKSRKGDKRFVLMDTHFNDDTLAWTLSPTTGSQSFHFVQSPLDHSYGEYLGQFTLTTTTNILIKKALRKHLDIKIASPSGLEALVVSLTGHTVVFGSHTLKQNVVFTHTATPTLTATPTVTGTISHVPSIIVKKKGDQLCVFVAKKLMTLANVPSPSRTSVREIRQSCPAVTSSCSRPSRRPSSRSRPSVPGAASPDARSMCKS